MILVKRLSILLLVIFTVLLNVCYANSLPKGTLTTEQLTLGYISFRDTPQNVTKVYGQPTRIDERNGMSYYYGDSLVFRFMGKNDSILYDITTTDDNGIKTADGIGVGMLVSTLFDTYGPPNYKRKDKEFTRYWYYWEKSSYVYFMYTVKNGIITEISLHYAD